MERSESKKFFGSEGVPRLYEILKGSVSSIQPYGAFIKLTGKKKDGLVHRSQISQARVEDPGEVLTIGEDVYCKVISVEDGGEKIGLSMKLVNQTDGNDLDPNNVQSSQDAQRRKQGYRKEINKIELEAIYNTTCKKCGGKGHMAQDCFHQAGSTSYELVPDMDDLMSAAQSEVKSEKSTSKKEHKHKKKKKKHKKRSTSSDDSDDNRKEKKRRDSSQSSKSEKKDKSKKHKHKSHRKRSHSDSSSDSDHHRKKAHKSTHR